MLLIKLRISQFFLKLQKCPYISLIYRRNRDSGTSTWEDFQRRATRGMYWYSPNRLTSSLPSPSSCSLYRFRNSTVFPCIAQTNFTVSYPRALFSLLFWDSCLLRSVRLHSAVRFARSAKRDSVHQLVKSGSTLSLDNFLFSFEETYKTTEGSLYLFETSSIGSLSIGSITFCIGFECRRILRGL